MWKCESCGAPNSPSNVACFNCKRGRPVAQPPPILISPNPTPYVPLSPVQASLSSIERRVHAVLCDAWIVLIACIVAFVIGFGYAVGGASAREAIIGASVAGAAISLALWCVVVILLCYAVYVLLRIEENTKGGSPLTTTVPAMPISYPAHPQKIDPVSQQPTAADGDGN